MTKEPGYEYFTPGLDGATQDPAHRWVDYWSDEEDCWNPVIAGRNRLPQGWTYRRKLKDVEHPHFI
jgi:hypothetical protein